MNKNPKRELLDDVLRDEDNLRQEVFEASLTELRRRKKRLATHLSFYWAIATGLAFGAGLLFFTCRIAVVASQVSAKQASPKPLRLWRGANL